MAKAKEKEKAVILTVGTFNEDGKPIDWKFDRGVRFTKCQDGVYRGGGHTGSELWEIAEKAKERAAGAGAGAPESPPEPTVPAAGETEPPPELDLDPGPDTGPETETKTETETIPAETEPDFVVIAEVTGISMKKPTTGPRVKEMKFVSSDLEALREFDEFMGSTVELTITARRYLRSEPENTGKSVESELESESGTAGEPPEPDTQNASDEKHGPEDEDKTKSVCTKCGADLEENPDDTTELICTNPDCAEPHVNTGVADVDFD